jgi:predicted metal-binding protein
MEKWSFKRPAPVRIVGFVSCGGCPGKRAITRAETMVEKAGAEIIVLASCISRGNPIGFPCPHFDTILESLKKRLGDKVEIFD